MKIKVIALGKLKETYYTEGVAYFSDRIKMSEDLEIIEIIDEKLNNKMSDAEIIKVLKNEEIKILEKIDKRDFVVALAIKGDISTTKILEKTMNYCKSNNKDIVFIIGSSFGLSSGVYQRADKQISFSNMTFTHQMMRMLLLEQISISLNE